MLRIIIIVVIIIGYKIYNYIFYSTQVGVIVLKKFNSKIVTILSLKDLIRYVKHGYKHEFTKDCKNFLKQLETGNCYYTYSHGLILKELKKEERKGNVKMIYEAKKKKNLFISQLIIGNFSGCKNIKRAFKSKVQYYNIYFIKKERVNLND